MDFTLKSSISRSVRNMSKSNFLKATCYLMLIMVFHAEGVGGFNEWRAKVGNVMARGLILTDDGYPTFTEYNADGSFGSDIAVLDDSLKGATVISGDAYRSSASLYNEFKSTYGDTIARGSEVLSAEVYQGKQFTTINDEAVESSAKAPLMSHRIKSVLVRNSNQLLIPQSDPVLMQSVINLDTIDDAIVNNSGIVSVLIDKDGNVIHASSKNIGLKAGFFKGEESNYKPENQEDIYSPVPAVGVELPMGYFGGKSATDGTGRFGVSYMLPPCPGFSFEYKTPITAMLYFGIFNPKGEYRSVIYPQTMPGYDYCSGISAALAGEGNLVGQMARVHIMGIEASMSIPIFDYSFLVDTAMLLGKGYVTNQNATGNRVPLPMSTTKYSYEAPDLKNKTYDGFDFDGDGSFDTAVLGDLKTELDENNEEQEVFTKSDNGNLQGIYLSSGSQNIESEDEALQKPDFVRVADKAPDFSHQGLLESIGKDEMADTDVLVFRESNGMLITSNEGMDIKDSQTINLGGVGEDGYMHFSMMLRGPSSSNWDYLGQGYWNAYGIGGGDTFSALQSEAGINSALHQREADHLRPSETLRVVAVNRSTGYIGTTRTSYSNLARSGGGILSLLNMRPPNLKIIAEREYIVDKGLTQGDEKKYLIGYEGAALASDKIIKITTEWFDHDGSPLPEGMSDYGYTGRLAKIVGDNTLGQDSSALANFSIKPGRHTQQVQIGSNATKNEHYYVQVSGEPIDGNPSFDTLGAGDGPLQYRPNNYVPILIPIADEHLTWQQYIAYKEYKKENPEAKLTKPEPIHKWFYRPELQFSLYSLEMKEILTQSTDAEGKTQEVDIYASDIPILTSGDDLLKVVYSLLEQEIAPLEFLGSGQELVLALGEEEVSMTVGEGQQLVFENLDHLSSLDVEDFLSMRLYTNNDASNILWEYAFEYLAIEPTTIGYENQTEDVWYVSADDPVVDMKATLLGYAYRGADKKPVAVAWQANGAGSFSPASQTSVDLGVFDSTLTMSPTKGATAKVSVKLASGDTVAQWKTVEVLAGAANNLTVTATGQAIAWQQGDVRLDISVFDQYGNLVEDGTEVNFDVLNSFIIKEQQLETIDGKAFIILSGGEYAVAESIITVTSGAASATETLSIEGFNVELTADTTNLNKQQTTHVTAKVTTLSGATVNNVPVTFSAARGFFSEQELLTDATGSATTQFTAGINDVDDTWHVQVGYIAANQLDYSVDTGSESINTSDTMLVADELEAGSVSFDYYGVSSSVGYETSATVNVKSADGGIVTLGDMADPNLEPLVSLSMAGFVSENTFKDEHGLDNVSTSNVTLVRDHPLGAGRSAKFASGASAVIKANAQFTLTDNIGTRVDIKPQGDGTVFSHGNTQQLSYTGDTLTFEVTTTTGTYAVQQSGVTAEQWHSVATKVADDTISLYVDGEVVNQSITGQLLYTANTDITLGGLSAIMRSFRVYDWNSAPLLSFADGSFSQSTAAGSDTLSLKSLGNLDKHHSSSQLQSLRVAIVSGEQRNYASLLTKRGYQAIATQYLSTVSPESPLAYLNLPNPLSGLVPSAHAWSWSGVWDGVKSTVGFLIPYEDFIIIYEQLGYLINQDWENFDSSKLAFASLGAATVIPIVKPLKPLLGPIKKMLDGMKKFPASRHFAGAVGTAVKEAFKGKTDKIINLLPFILITIELYEEPEVFEFIMSAIESEDDLWVWVDFLAQALALEGGLEVSANYLYDHQSLNYVANPASFIIDNAHAAGFTRIQRASKKIIDNVKKYSSIIPAHKAKQITKGWKSIKDTPLAKMALKSGSLMRYFAILGGNKIRQFVKNSESWRVNRWFVLFSIVYLSEEFDEKRLKIDTKKLYSLIGAAFSKRKNTSNGALFHISQLAYAHAMHQLGAGPKVLGIEETRAAAQILKGKPSGKVYNRRVDLVVEGSDGGEHWIELKSYARSSFSQSTFKNVHDKKGSPYREFFHDLRVNEHYINADNAGLITATQNEQYTWYFHNWRSNALKGQAPTTAEETKVRKWLCQKPNMSYIKNYYNDNLKLSTSATQSACNSSSAIRIKLRDTESYITEVIQRLIDEKGLAAGDFIQVIKGID